MLSMTLILCLCVSADIGLAHNDETVDKKSNISKSNEIDRTIQCVSDNTSSSCSPPSLTQPTEVKIGIYVNSFYSISEQTMDYSISFYLRQAWTDPRLQFVPVAVENGSANITSILLGEDSRKKIWKPDTFFRNEKAAAYHDVTTQNKLLKVNATGEVWYVVKISGTFSCHMNLKTFPMDKHRCPIMFESFAYNVDQMYYTWLPSAVDIDRSVHLPQFSLEEFTLKDCSQSYTAGAYPCLQVDFVIKRDIGYYLIQVYIPSVLMVIVSWFSFWIDPESMDIRVSVGLLSLVTITTIAAGVTTTLPPVSYIKAIDVWMSVCLLFIILSLLEIGIVHINSIQPKASVAKAYKRVSGKKSGPRRGYRKSGSKCSTCCNSRNMEERKSSDNSHNMSKEKSSYISCKPKRIDNVSRLVFPFAFIVFNVVYWVYYLNCD